MERDYENVRIYLESERKRLAEELTSKTGHGIDDRREGSPFGKREEAADQGLELEMELALLQRIGKQLAEVEHALEKFEKGTYGMCDSCGNPIPPARLAAIPQANLCLDCKARHCKS